MNFVASVGVWLHESPGEGPCKRCGASGALTVGETRLGVFEGPWCTLKCWGAFHDERARIIGTAPEPTGHALPPWPTVVARWPLVGEPGITLRSDTHGLILLYRGAEGYLGGALWRRNGAISVLVDPAHRREGIGQALVRAAGRRWPINLDAPVTAAGAALAKAALPAVGT